MKVIPVIDALNGVAVHGIRGERKHYHPLKSRLCKSTDPLELVSLFESLGFTDLYLADLDAILDNKMNLNLFKQISQTTSLDLMVDAATSNLVDAKKLVDTKVPKLVIGSETLENLDFVQHAVKEFGNDNVVVSVDQKNGKLLSRSDVISSLTVCCFIGKLVDLGVNQIIFLDLGRVGTEHGTDFGLIQSIIETTEVELLVGGGIRNLNELEKLRNIRVFGALIATVLHNMTLTVDELKSAGLL